MAESNETTFVPLLNDSTVEEEKFDLYSTQENKEPLIQEEGKFLVKIVGLTS